MKKFLIFLCAFVIAAADDEPAVDCENWPSNLKKVEECCNIPFHSNSLIQNICYSKCVIKAKDLQDDCTAECYVNMTGLIKEGTINKVAVKRIYENNCFSDRRWAKTISDAVDKCEYDSSESVMKNLVKFYNCADDFLAANCVSFIQSVECDATEDHFEQCKKIEPNCTAWPIDLMHPDVCCKIPKLISDDLTTKCRFGCQRKEFFSHKQVECMQNCTYIDTGLKLNGKFDFEVVKKILMESTNKTEAWEKPIGEAAEVCEKLLKEKEDQKMGEQSITIQLMRCLSDQLVDKCVEYESGPFCNKVKRFVTKCPETKPRSLKTYYMSGHVTYYNSETKN